MKSQALTPLKWHQFTYIRLWQEIWPYAGSQKKVIIGYHLMYAVAISISITIPYWVGQLVNTLQTSGPNLLQDASYYMWLIIMCQFCFWGLHAPGRIMERRASQIVMVNFTSAMFGKLTDLPLSWHQDHHSGSTINRINKSSGAMKSFVESSYASFQGMSYMAGSIAMLIWFKPMIGLISLGCFIVAMQLIITLNKRMTAAVHDNNEAQHQASATFFDFVSNIVSIIILRLQSFSRTSLEKRLDLAMKPFMREVKINEVRYFIYAMLHVVMLATILLGYIKLQIDAGTVVATGSLVTIYLYQSRIGDQGYTFLLVHSQWLSGLTNIASTKTMIEDHKRHAKPANNNRADNWHEITLKNVDFSYKSAEGAPKSTLKDINLSMRKGERIALIGTSGAGKSTLLSLLRALHTPENAEVMIDGKAAEFSDLAQLTTLIPQDPEIFENTIRFNVSFGLDVTEGDIMRAIRLAEFDHVLSQMDNGLDTDIREKGVNLSVGQKQRLALSRGIFAAETSDIILLDEPTSSIDLPTEERIFKNLFTHFEGKTIVATLHRLHLLPKFDRIIFLDEGRITADLSSADALSVEGPIRALYDSYQRKAA